MAQTLAFAVEKKNSIFLYRSLSLEGQEESRLLQSDPTNYNFWKKVHLKEICCVYLSLLYQENFSLSCKGPLKYFLNAHVNNFPAKTSIFDNLAALIWRKP